MQVFHSFQTSLDKDKFSKEILNPWVKKNKCMPPSLFCSMHPTTMASATIVERYISGEDDWYK